MHRHIIYIINPIAGTKGKKNLQSIIEQRTKKQGIAFDIFPSVSGGDYTFLHPQIEGKKTTDIVIAGGDGTVNQVMSSLMNFNIRFGILPVGSGNGLAFSANIPKHPAKALDVIFQNNASAIDGFYINGRFSCMLCGLGLDAKVANDFAQQSKRGLSAYIRQAVKNFFKAKPYSFEIILQDTTFTTDAYFICIANSNQFGNNFTIAPRASLNDGLLDIVIATGQKKFSLLLQTLKQVSGRNPLETGHITMNKKGYIYFQTERLAIVNKSMAPLHIDGEPVNTSEKFQIEIQKNCLQLLQPV